MPARKPFDPSRVRVPDGERSSADADSAIITPHAVNELVRGVLARHIPRTLHVLGEVGNLSRPQSGHLYFSLKDAHSELRCVMWRSAASKLKFTPETGMEIIATGEIDVYTPRGTYQLLARKLEPRGVGALEVAFRQLRERLEREGLFDQRRKKPLPAVPRRVAVVTSPSGAAIRDVLQTLSRRFPALEVLVYPVRVQGDGAADEIARAIRQLNLHQHALGGIDVMIVGRGGGSLEDLWAFNEEPVVRAIANSEIPIVSAVGHEVDVSISDLAADVRAATPTAAAELVAPRLDDLIERLAGQSRRAARAARHALDLSRGWLDTGLARGSVARPLARLRERGQLLDERQQRLRGSLAENLRTRQEHLSGAELALLRCASDARFVRLAQGVDQRVFRLSRAAQRLLARRAATLQERRWRVERALPAQTLARADERVRQLIARLHHDIYQAVLQRRRLLRAKLDAVTAHDPRSILTRGYSITRDARTRRVLRSVSEIREAMRVSTELADGEFAATAEDPRQARLFD